MLRRISGSSFALAMIFIIALKHTALGFCLCQQEFTTAGAGCDCAQEAAVEATCGCCPDQSNAPAPDPCDDCIVDVSVDPGDFLWSSKAFEPSDEIGIPLALPVGKDDLHPGKHSGPQALAPARGSPPGGPPLFIWTRVLRL